MRRNLHDADFVKRYHLTNESLYKNVPYSKTFNFQLSGSKKEKKRGEPLSLFKEMRQLQGRNAASCSNWNVLIETINEHFNTFRFNQ
jgi:hypothetical protein